MTLPSTGLIGLGSVDVEVGTVGMPMSLGWVRDHSYYAYKDLDSIHGLTWFKAVSSQNSITRTTALTTTNCVNADTTTQGNPRGFTRALTNCAKREVTNCDQCAYDHGTYLQKNCNCNCNCSACNCNYVNCNCAVCHNCNNQCGSGTCSGDCIQNCNVCCYCNCTCSDD